MVIKGSEGSFSCGIIRGLLLSKDEQNLTLVILVRESVEVEVPSGLWNNLDLADSSYLLVGVGSV